MKLKIGILFVTFGQKPPLKFPFCLFPRVNGMLSLTRCLLSSPRNLAYFCKFREQASLFDHQNILKSNTLSTMWSQLINSSGCIRPSNSWISTLMSNYCLRIVCSCCFFHLPAHHLMTAPFPKAASIQVVLETAALAFVALSLQHRGCFFHEWALQQY